mmetsp:Transcript_92264/g.246698  ORF Transcript_92264/g.246698 Transcript_92264/m.246698 type:complete len:245 (+) Transcript_92264:16-750(+)
MALLFRAARVAAAVGTTAVAGWEFRRRQLIAQRDQTREDFRGSSSFYGKMWGWEVDYQLMITFWDGDLVLAQHHLPGLPVHEAMLVALRRAWYKSSWDMVGVVHRPGGRVDVAMLGRAPGQEGVHALGYADLLAAASTGVVAVRRVKMEDEDRKQMREWLRKEIQNPTVRGPTLIEEVQGALGAAPQGVLSPSQWVLHSLHAGIGGEPPVVDGIQDLTGELHSSLELGDARLPALEVTYLRADE